MISVSLTEGGPVVDKRTSAILAPSAERVPVQHEKLQFNLWGLTTFIQPPRRLLIHRHFLDYIELREAQGKIYFVK